ncbi:MULTISPECIES: hypothetical protein [unclassified Burkholderia]|uniref:hypothetical protein n=1 Tax=unclassified Burkholderia TaxID=2613784 RepID=UPI00075209BC|nr:MULTISPECIES: hypothetical protein [unclassified Burkholderia]KVN18039.1 hypothetical protein WT08_02655 [Burkholderia sp. MSMB1552]KWZ55409.1 hypothetical protein WS92_05415 [Burkholderia sp. MSMB1588]
MPGSSFPADEPRAGDPAARRVDRRQRLPEIATTREQVRTGIVIDALMLDRRPLITHIAMQVANDWFHNLVWNNTPGAILYFIV